MPAKSAKQYKLMQTVLHGVGPTVKDSPSKAVAREIVEKTPKKQRSMFSR
jgi:hypothetical protein